jgi:hypothetical protein
MDRLLVSLDRSWIQTGTRGEIQRWGRALVADLTVRAVVADFMYTHAREYQIVTSCAGDCYRSAAEPFWSVA